MYILIPICTSELHDDTKQFLFLFLLLDQLVNDG